MARQPRQTLTPEAYLELERAGEQRHEYDGTALYAMAGGSEQHNLICGNVYAAMHGQIRRRPCTVYTSDMRVFIPSTGLYTYPDISALCGMPLFIDGHRDTLLNPTVIIDVLSPSTEMYDRGREFRNYRPLDALQEYVLIEQDTVYVEHYRRQPNGQWLLDDVADLAASIDLATIGCEIAVSDMYERVFDREQ